MSAQTHSPRWERLAHAATFALKIHADQVRKGAGTPYVGHLLSVAGLVLEHGGSEDAAIAALLHDAIEDQGVHQEAAIAALFGPRVAGIVRDCTDADTTPKPPWQARKEAYIAHLEHASEDALLVSACDKLHNGRSIVTDLRTHGRDAFSRFSATPEQTLWFYSEVSAVITRRLPGPLAAELAEAVQTMQHLGVAEA